MARSRSGTSSSKKSVNQRRQGAGAERFSAMEDASRQAEAELAERRRLYERAEAELERAQERYEQRRARAAAAVSPAARAKASGSARTAREELTHARERSRETRRAMRRAQEWLRSVELLNMRSERSYLRALAAAQHSHVQRAARPGKRATRTATTSRRQTAAR